jgi:transposase InsO family protein
LASAPVDHDQIPNSSEFLGDAQNSLRSRTVNRIWRLWPMRSSSFNGKFRDECLDEHWFLNLAHAIATIEGWRVHYNTVRPRSSLGNRTPEEFARLSMGARRLLPPPDRSGLVSRGANHIAEWITLRGQVTDCTSF